MAKRTKEALPTTDMRLTRRAFHRIAGSISAGWLAARFGQQGTADEQPKKQWPEGRYVDVHTHLGQTWNTTQPLTAEGLLRWMDANDIAQAVVLPLINPEASSYPLTTDFVLRQTEPHRERLIPFCSVDPRTSFSGGHKGLVEMLQKYKDAGCRGFGEHKPGVPMDDPRNIAIFKACAEVKLPLLFHLDNQRNTDKPGLPGLEAALKAAPECILIGHGPGIWASISGDATQNDLGGYPKGPVAEGGALDKLLEKYANFYLDLSAGSGAQAISRDEKFGREFLIRRADRLMFGTDYLSPGQAVPQLELYGKLDLPEEVQAKVFRENARRLLFGGGNAQF